MPLNEGEYSTDGFPYHNRDILKNMSRLKGTCIVCCKVNVETIMPEIEEGYITCECGNLVHAKNTVVWC
jgi:hypothetical protein